MNRPVPSDSLPPSVTWDNGFIVPLSTGHPLPEHINVDEEEFWASLRKKGGKWMWEQTYTRFGLDPIMEAIASGIAVFVTDGSYSRKIRSDISGAGWLIYCSDCTQVLFKGSFYEICPQAGSYCGKLLGLLAVHVFIHAVESFMVLTREQEE